MNDLSWFLYLADVLPGASGSLETLSLLVIFIGVVVLVVWKAIYLSEREIHPSTAVDVPKSLYWVWGTFFLLFLLTQFIPSRETIYLIAGSEAGEAVVTSETGQEILDDIHQVIKHQLNSLKGE